MQFQNTSPMSLQLVSNNLFITGLLRQERSKAFIAYIRFDDQAIGALLTEKLPVATYWQKSLKSGSSGFLMGTN